MTSTYFTADLHLWHRRILDYANRPFRNLDHMHDAIITNWNTVVTDPDALVWILGDFAIDGGWRDALSLLPRLNGRKRLITGNHDRCWAGKPDGMNFQHHYIEGGFEAVDSFARFKLPPTTKGIAGRQVLLSHFPYAADHTSDTRHDQFRLRDNGDWLLHGHVHEAYTVKERGVNVGIDRWDYRPVPATTIAHLIDDVEAGRRPEDP